MMRIRYNESFETEKAADDWMDREYSLYGYGYGTNLSKKQEGDKWIVTGVRYSSCN
jgi:hypothetical protein